MVKKMICRHDPAVLVPDSILDVAEGRLIRGKSVALKNGDIAGLLSSQERAAWVERERAQTVDLTGLTLLPGLIDCHVHFALDGVDFNQALERWKDPAQMEAHVKSAVAGFVEHGVLAVRDGSDIQGIGFRTKSSAAGSLVVRTTGFAIRRQGRYGTFLGPGVRDTAEAKRQIAQLARQGVDQIKVVVSGLVSFSQYGQVGPIQFSVPELKEIVRACHETGLPVMAHASSEAGVRTAVEAGVDSVEHGYFLSDASLEAMVQKGTAWVPTLIPIAVQARKPYADTHSPEGVCVLERTFRLQMEKIQKAVSLGVLLGIGTDAGAIGVRHGSSYFEEVQLFQEAGLSNGVILHMAIAHGAKIIGLEDRLGAVEPGKMACLLGIKGNPLSRLSALEEVQVVVC
ncbi:amidohydrolase family protein [Candidatus Formimonas warabiya]|uniref:Amidohydrolase-related domain-containing protein n=1 Tax=Formimonas warabiya TaxID=1761012 RepID=A0A3G1KRW2_FORW1|nr:amidohydrolase family protein [Candidatus Formimonas warabiya]ATW25186.1 hypothetical protein DCMF_10755 [Candidatus Formimonas warabiya]